ncbi:hypothetical protein N7533_002507 [Penicillium manginii]|uniref:uncharacterized protein n=1 Tax=Penicillium manginii TaxID=203109 RepID=UPI0025477E2C|nr:uncharacterized protein N7533_002507 [Penicillium manginii]KAJ5763826.1 hypothetical protein N7533_002507 [Penicillium manginii]
MNSLVATPPVPPHFYEHSRFSPSRIMSTPSSSYTSRKRKADDDGNDHDGRMSASPTNSPAFTPRQLPLPSAISNDPDQMSLADLLLFPVS